MTSSSLPLPYSLHPQCIRSKYLIIRRKLPCSARSLALILLILFITSNLIVYSSYSWRLFLSSPSILDPELPIDRRESSSWMQSAQHTFAQTSNWTTEWFQRFYLDPSLNDSEGQNLRIDIVYTWVNGSDPKLIPVKEKYEDQSPFFQAYRAAEESRWGRFRNLGLHIPAKNTDQTANRYRDLNELKYSVRSVSRYFSRSIFNRIHILATAVSDDEEERIGGGEIQVPSWLDLEASGDQVRMVPHGVIFDNKTFLPSFNSLAIESQMHNIPGVTDIFLYLNDDVFLGLEMSAADIWTPLYGFVFHMEPTLLVPPNILPVPQSTLSVGEWNSLQYSNNLLSRQFGPRHRSYLAHVPHVLCAPMLQEIQSLWPEEFSKTSSHRFRGEGSAEDIQVSFFMAHYVIERLRETQLESFWNYRLDANMDGVLDWSERATFINRVRVWNEKQAQLAELLSGPKAYTYVSEFNSSLKNYEVNLARLGYQSSESSFYQLSGLDGYPFMIQPNNPNHVDDMTRNSMNDNNNANNNDKNNNNKPFLPFISVDTRYCQINIDFCFGSKFLDPNISTIDKSTSSEIFESIAFSKFQCGDCLLHMLRQYGSSSGLGAEILPLDTQSQAFQSVIADMAKYNFVIATSAYSFVQLFEPRDASNKLDTIIQRETIEAFFCINDNAGENPATVDQIRKVFAEFLDTRFPTSSPWEKTDWPIVSG